jgi:hypothetical protein
VNDNTQPTPALTENGPRLISERKQRANRENAKKSTGPRTARGKALSRRNAIKHGFFARDLFPLLVLPTESEEEFLDFCEQLYQEYQPVGSEEESEVGRIAICRWRLRRVWRYENAEISRAVFDTCQEKFRKRYWERRHEEQSQLRQGQDQELVPDFTPFSEQLKLACEQQAIPKRHVVDKVIRYEPATERSLRRALERLETLQQRRRGEAPPPRLNVNIK